MQSAKAQPKKAVSIQSLGEGFNRPRDICPRVSRGVFLSNRPIRIIQPVHSVTVENEITKWMRELMIFFAIQLVVDYIHVLN